MRAKKAQRITFRVTQLFLADLKKAAKDDQRTLSEWIQIKLARVIADQNSQKVAAA